MKQCSKIDNSTSLAQVVHATIKSDAPPPFSTINSDSNCEHIKSNYDSDTDSSYDKEMKIMTDRMPQMLMELNNQSQAISEKSKLRYKNKKPITGHSRANVKDHFSKSSPHPKSSFHCSEKAFALQKHKTSAKLKSKYRQKLPPKPGTKTSESHNKTFRNTSDNKNDEGPSDSNNSEDEESVDSEIVNDTDQSSEVSDTEMLELKNLTLKNVNSVYGGTYYEDVSVRKKHVILPSNLSNSKELNHPSTKNECGNSSTCSYELSSSESKKNESAFKFQSGKSCASTKNEGSRKGQKIPDSGNEKVPSLKKDNKKKQKNFKSDFGQGLPAGPSGKFNYSRDDSSKFSNCDQKSGKHTAGEKTINNSKKIKNTSLTNNGTDNKEANIDFKTIPEGEKSTCKKERSKPKKSEFVPKAILKRPQHNDIHQSPSPSKSSESSVVEPIEDATKDDNGIDMDMSDFLDKMLEQTSVMTPATMNASSVTVTQRSIPQDEDLDKLFEESLCKPSFASRKRLLNNKLT